MNPYFSVFVPRWWHSRFSLQVNQESSVNHHLSLKGLKCLADAWEPWRLRYTLGCNAILFFHSIECNKLKSWHQNDVCWLLESQAFNMYMIHSTELDTFSERKCHIIIILITLQLRSIPSVTSLFLATIIFCQKPLIYFSVSAAAHLQTVLCWIDFST